MKCRHKFNIKTKKEKSKMKVKMWKKKIQKLQALSGKFIALWREQSAPSASVWFAAHSDRSSLAITHCKYFQSFTTLGSSAFRGFFKLFLFFFLNVQVKGWFSSPLQNPFFPRVVYLDLLWLVIATRRGRRMQSYKAQKIGRINHDGDFSFYYIYF